MTLTPPGSKFIEPRSHRESALDVIERLRNAVDQQQITDAVEQLTALQTIVQNWQRTVVIAGAKAWLDTALQEDLLLFNTGEAERYLSQWEAVSATAQHGEDFDLGRYKRRVEERAGQKQAALYVHGVTTYCESLLTRATELERGDAPPHPDFVLTNYYNKAYAIAEAARVEHADSPELGVLTQKTERLQSQKMTTAKLYGSALTKQAYTEVLYELNQLPAEILIPRFANEAGVNAPSFVGMVSVSQARRELLSLAQEWATGRATVLIQTAQLHLDAHNPQAALDSLEARDITPYLKDEQRTQLETVRKTAEESLFQRNQAQEQSQHALKIASANPLEAWDAYAQAYNFFQWLPELTEVRRQVVAALDTQIDQIIAKTDQAFYDREMNQVRQLSQNTTRLYGGKDSGLDIKLERFKELEDMTRQYDEYLTNAEQTYEQVKSLLYEDAVAANDLLTQLESYPDLVLLSFPDLGELREIVNRRLSANQMYGQLYGQVYAEELDLVSEAVEMATTAVEDYPDDGRFRPLIDALTLHRDFIVIQSVYRAGQPLSSAQLTRLGRIAVIDHPDRGDAQRLLDELRPPAPPVSSVEPTVGRSQADDLQETGDADA